MDGVSLLHSRTSSHSSESEDSFYYPKDGQRTPYYVTRARKRYLMLACVSLAAVSLMGLAGFSLWSTHPSWRLSTVGTSQPSATESSIGLDLEDVEVTSPPVQELDPLDPLASLNGPPTMQFRDNLRPEVKYITSWISAGWTNDVMTYANLIYLALITDRVPIVPMFTPSHIGGGVPPIAFGDVFDVPRLRQLLARPVLEWREVKDSHSDSLDDLGCWNVWESVQYNEHHPRGSVVVSHLKLDISYTKTPSWVKLIPDFVHDFHATFWSLARLAFPETRAANLVPALPSPIHNVSLPPDEQLLCYDYLYYVCAQQPYEYDSDYSPAWRYVAQHMHWTPSLQNLANAYINRALGLPENESTPPYIGIHVRHYDFAVYCGDTPLHECYASIPVIARRVREVRDELLEKKGIAVNHVIMTSDERNETWWQEVAEQGWARPDHSHTKELYGDWYPVLIDAVIQSSGVGFVGTDMSTMSVLAKRRVQSWQEGFTRLVKWGRPDSDDH